MCAGLLTKLKLLPKDLKGSLDCAVREYLEGPIWPEAMTNSLAVFWTVRSVIVLSQDNDSMKVC